MDKRHEPRIERRLPCIVATVGGRSPGLIHDVSSVGLFVETSAKPELHSVVRLLFKENADQPRFFLEAGVARARIVPAQLATSIPAGIGLEVIPPRSAFERWVVAPACPKLPASEFTLAPLGSQSRGGLSTYRVRLIRQDRPGSQILTLRCESESAARAKALRRVGGDWRVAESQPV
jgi:hypothetical protein